MKKRRRVGGAYLLRDAASDVVRPSERPSSLRLRPATVSAPPPSSPSPEVVLPPPARVPEISLIDMLQGRVPDAAQPTLELPTLELPQDLPTPDLPQDLPTQELPQARTHDAAPAQEPGRTRRSTIRPKAEGTTDHVGAVKIDALGSEPPAPEEQRSPLTVALHQLCTSGPEDAEVLLSSVLSKEGALPLLVANFPGPLWFDRRQPYRRLPAGQQVSAISMALVRIGGPTAPYLAEMLLASQADMRFYAALVAADVPAAELLVPLARLALDRDYGVRKAAIRALQRHADIKGFGKVLGRLRQVGSDPHARPVWRARALNASARLGDALILSPLVEALASRDRTLAREAHRGLRQLTCHDLGTMRLPWSRWQRRHGQRHRVSWLIDALADRRDELRVMAFHELRRLSNESFGLSDDAPRSTFIEAQKHYARWWQTR